MKELIEPWFPYVAAYWKEFIKAIASTFQMFFIAGLIAFILGFVFGVVLTVTKPDGIKPRRVIYRIVDLVINIFRSIPFIILLIFLIPLTRAIMGTAVGVKGAVVPLVFGCIPFFTRQVESALANIDAGKVEAARAMGSGTLGIIFRVYLHEAVPDLIRATTITAISLIGLTTMAGAVGAGGIGSFAINYGQNQHHQDIVNICVIILLILVSLIQGIGNFLARKTTNRGLFRKKV